MHRVLTAAALTLALASPAAAQTIIDGTNVEDIVNAARGFGSATLERHNDGSMGIRGRIDGNAYYAALLNCESETSCEDFAFQAYILKPEIDLTIANTWNSEHRWSKLYFDNEDDAVLQMSVNLDGGVTNVNLDQSFMIWSGAMEDFFSGNYIPLN